MYKGIKGVNNMIEQENDIINENIKKLEKHENDIENDKIISMINQSDFEINEAWNKWCRLKDMGLMSQIEFESISQRCAILQQFNNVLIERRKKQIME